MGSSTELIASGSGAYPRSFYRLGIPTPENTITTSIASGSDDGTQTQHSTNKHAQAETAQNKQQTASSKQQAASNEQQAAIACISRERRPISASVLQGSDPRKDRTPARIALAVTASRSTGLGASAAAAASRRLGSRPMG